MFLTFVRRAAPVLFSATLFACGGGGSDPGAEVPVLPPVVVPTPTASLAVAPAALTIVAGNSATATVTLTRGGGFAGAVALVATGAATGVTVTTADIAASATTATITVAVAAPTAAGAGNVTLTGSAAGVTIAPLTLAVTVEAAPVPGVAPIGAGIVGEAAGDESGYALALSADGTRVAIGAWVNDGANGANSGHVRVYQKSGSSWTQLGADIDGEAAGDRSGTSVAMSADGSRVVIGAYLAGGNQASGQVRVYELVAGAWTQIGADIDGAYAQGFGFAVAMSADGRRIIAGAPGVNNTNGYAVVYEQSGNAWVRMGAVIDVAGTDEFGQAVDMSDDGNRVVISAPGAAGTTRPGTTYVYAWNGTAWAPLGAPIAGEALGDIAGTSVSLSGDGARLAIGAPSNKGGGVSGGGSPSGQVRVYGYDGTGWVQVGGDVDGKVGVNGDAFGQVVALSGDGTRFVASSPNGGAARVYTLTGGAWVQTGADLVGARTNGVAISADGHTAAVGFIYFQPGAIGKTQVYAVTQ